MKIVPIFVAALVMPLCAQNIKLPANLDKLAAKADEAIDVTLEGPMLRMAGRFASDKEKGNSGAAKLLASLQSILVRSFQFSSEGQYDAADVEAIRTQLKSPQWSRIVGVTSKRDGDNADVYFKDGGNGNLGGIVVLCAGRKELTIVSIVGNLDPSQLADLGGQFGVPKLDLGINLHGKKDEK